MSRRQKGGRPYPHWLINGFQSVVEECELNDVPLRGYSYTWERNYGDDEWVEIRLDRVLVSNDFLQKFSETKLSNLEISTSDHSPIFLEPVVISHVNSARRFRFENSWLREPMCLQIVKETWQKYRGKNFQEKLSLCADILSTWGKEITGNFKARISASKKKLRIMKGMRDVRSTQVYKEILKEISEVYKQQEIFWRQHSKQLWLKEGDHNSIYFHAATKMRRKVNHIHNLQNKEGTLVSWDTGLKETMVEYFNELFTASNTDWRKVIGCVTRGITEDQNSMLLRNVDKQEVKKATFSMHPDKSPGPDGMSPGFYQK